MSRDQMVFAAMFRGQTYGPRVDFEPRDWQVELSGKYDASVGRHLIAHSGNGDSGQHAFCIYAGTGSGKTKAVALLAASMLNQKHASQVVLVCPNKSILRQTRNDLRAYFGIDLVSFNKRKHADGIPSTKQGYILTYANLIVDPTLHRRICSPDTLVIFDEVHHLGDNSGWGEASLEAFERVRFVISLTGTPYRSDNTKIPFVTYEATPIEGIWRFKADFVYSLGRAVHEGVCREPLFVFCGGDEETKVRIRTNPNSGELLVSFLDTSVPEAIASLRLRGAVQFGSTPRKAMLKAALDQCRAEGRKVIIFLGGDTDGDHTPTVDARDLLPSELRELGFGDHEFVAITGEDPKAQEEIQAFGASEKWIMIAINMVSEGTNIPELSAAILLTTITAKQTTVQRIGRVLRLNGPDDPHKAALIFLFQDPELFELAREIKAEIERESRIISKHASGQKGGDDSASLRYRPEAIGISGGLPTTIAFANKSWPVDVFDAAKRSLDSNNLSCSLLEVAMTLLLREAHEFGVDRFIA